MCSTALLYVQIFLNEQKLETKKKMHYSGRKDIVISLYLTFIELICRWILLAIKLVVDPNRDFCYAARLVQLRDQLKPYGHMMTSVVTLHMRITPT